jgi:VIT1/CCC1 family predicted Fe2+/Mn2+ transporter
MEKELLLVCLDWIAANTSSLVQLLGALVPVVALVVVGYALHITHKKGGRK